MGKRDTFSQFKINDVNTISANILKEVGNEEFKAKNYSKSLELYTRAIDLYGLPLIDRSILYSNRCICYIKLNQLSLAIIDAQFVQSLRPQWWKGYYRMAQIYYTMKGIEYLNKAEYCLIQAQNCDKNEEISHLLNKVRRKNVKQERNDDMDYKNDLNSTEDRINYYFKTTDIKLDSNDLKEIKDFAAKSKDRLLRNLKECKKGHRYRNGTNGYPLNYEQAVKCYTNAAKRGSAEGYYNLSQMVSEGNGVKQDLELAFEYLMKAAEQSPYNEIGGQNLRNIGVAEAKHTIGLWYETGIFVNKNIYEAIKWYEKAIDHEYGSSANDLGIIYKNGNEFIEKDLEKAEHYLKIAANNGNRRAMKNLAELYVEMNNPEMTLNWCKFMREQGFECLDLNNIEMEAKLKLSTNATNQSKTEETNKPNKAYLKNPYRIRVIREHRQLNKDSTMFVTPEYARINMTFNIPQNEQKSSKSMFGLKSKCLNKMDRTYDHVYNGCKIDFKSIDIVSTTGSSLILVVEDVNKNVERCAIYNSPLLNDINKANKLYGIGCQFSVINPYMRMAYDSKPVIRIDDISSIVMGEFIENMCRYCCESNAKKCCSRCKTAMYCSRECQLNDYKLNEHKLICLQK